MAKKKEAVIEGEEVEAAAEVEQTQAQVYKAVQLKTKADKQAEKRASVVETIKAEAKAYEPDLRGTWIPFTEKSGKVSPAMVIAERFAGEDMVLTLYVFSPDTAQPYRAERTI